MNDRIAIVNGVTYGSTYTICELIKQELIENNCEVLTIYGWTKKHRKSKERNEIIGSFSSRLFHLLYYRLTKREGSLSYFETKKIIKRLQSFRPSVINLHLLHCQTLNFKILFKYIKTNNIKLVWTFHDCWAFTGGCFHFDYEKCYQWKEKCNTCCKCRAIQRKAYSKMFSIKKEVFTSIKNTTIVTPSKWLANLVKQSFFNNFDVKTINNGIDLTVFKKTQSNFRASNNLDDKTIILGVAFGWNYKKGLDVFVKLANDLDANKYKIILVGTDSKIRKKIPHSILAIDRTNNVGELVDVYSSADVFVCPTREDNYPTVLMESISCGTPVVSFDTGGCKEIIDKSKGGVCVDKDDYDSIKRAILEEKYVPFCKSINRTCFDRKIMSREYLELLINS